MPPIVDEKAKENLIMCKNIRQATCKILQRPSYFQDHKTSSNQLEQKSKIGLNIQPNSKLMTDSTVEKNFESTFLANVTNGERYSSYEYEFEKLHKSQLCNNYYEEIEEIRPFQLNR